MTLRVPVIASVGQRFVHAVQGDREVVVGGAEGRAALALALRVADVVKSSPLAAPAAG